MSLLPIGRDIPLIRSKVLVGLDPGVPNQWYEWLESVG